MKCDKIINACSDNRGFEIRFMILYKRDFIMKAVQYNYTNNGAKIFLITKLIFINDAAKIDYEAIIFFVLNSIIILLQVIYFSHCYAHWLLGD